MGNLCPILLCMGVRVFSKSNMEPSSEKITDEEIINYLAQLGSPPLPKENRTVFSLGSHGVLNYANESAQPPSADSYFDTDVVSVDIPDVPVAPDVPDVPATSYDSDNSTSDASLVKGRDRNKCGRANCHCPLVRKKDSGDIEMGASDICNNIEDTFYREFIVVDPAA